VLAAAADLAGELGLDPDRLAVAGFSAGAPLAVRLAAHPPRPLRSAVACYGPLVEVPADTAPPPVLVVGAGRDHPELNATVDAFVAAALAANRPLELVNHPDGHHASSARG
jgi:dienelactone hydrolase